MEHPKGQGRLRITTPSSIAERYRVLSSGRISQGDIFGRIEIDKVADYKDGEVCLKTIVIDNSVVLSQDCDLESDYNEYLLLESGESYNHSSLLQNILICPAFNYSDFINGVHLGVPISKCPTEIRKLIETDREKRYQLLPADAGREVPQLILDFKHVYAVNREVMYAQKIAYIASINEMFRESVAQRFAYFISRVGLPDLRPKESGKIEVA